ncbi:hypothetical protein SUDANB176_06279 [Streptomyces sp. enrichment culture]|uniref:hypothetical protein n=1 Tax=Streptomyces sp. enrichment culture TaxID=1795815 RepID=UPI003F571AB6
MSRNPNGVTPPPLRLGHGTDGLAGLRPDDALTPPADLGDDGVGPAPAPMHLDPPAPDPATRTHRAARSATPATPASVRPLTTSPVPAPPHGDPSATPEGSTTP